MGDRNTDKVYILNVGISAIDMGDACARIEDAILKKHKIYICVCPVSTIMACKRDKNVLAGVNSADLATPDGILFDEFPSVRMGLKNNLVWRLDMWYQVIHFNWKSGWKSRFLGKGFGIYP